MGDHRAALDADDVWMTPIFKCAAGSRDAGGPEVRQRVIPRRATDLGMRV
jgi:hypothetical protein